MGLTVRFESPPGTVLPTPRFSPGQQVRVTGKAIGAASIPDVGVDIHLQVSGSWFSPIEMSGQANILGNYWFDLTMPNQTGKAVVKVYRPGAWFSPVDSRVIPIGIGVDPDVATFPGEGGPNLLLPLVLVGVTGVGAYLLLRHGRPTAAARVPATTSANPGGKRGSRRGEARMSKGTPSKRGMRR